MESLALIELDSIAAGIRTVDAVCKAARVDLLDARPIDPGKYLIMFRGDVGSVESAYRGGIESGGHHIVDQLHLPHAHTSILPILDGEFADPEIDAVGVIETSSVASIVDAADKAAKAAPTTLLRIHLARRIGGKGYLVLTGSQSDVEASVEAGSAQADRNGCLVEQVVIPAPADEILSEIIKDWIDQ